MHSTTAVRISYPQRYEFTADKRPVSAVKDQVPLSQASVKFGHDNVKSGRLPRFLRASDLNLDGTLISSDRYAGNKTQPEGRK